MDSVISRLGIAVIGSRAAPPCRLPRAERKYFFDAIFTFT